ncbi:MAG: DUF935 family protein [Gluconobacter japonicus]
MAGKLIDQYGNPIETKVLTQEIAGPDYVGQRPAILTNPPIGLNPEILGDALRAADAGDSLAWQTIAEIIEEKDAHYQGVLGTRKRSVAQLPITVDPASDDPQHKKHAEFIQDWLRLGLLENSLQDILDAIGKGWSVHELTWDLQPGCNRIAEMEWRPQRWFEPSYQDGETILIRDLNAEPAPASVAGAPVQAGFRAMPAHKFAVHRHKSWSGLTLRSGLTRTVAFLVMFKAFTTRDWGLFVQSYGLPLRIGKFGPGASEEQKRVLRRAVFDLMGAAGAIIPDSMQLELIEPKHGAGSNDIHQRRCDWIDAQISKVVLGQTGTTDSKQGAHASGAIHRLVQEDIERADARLVSVTVNKQMVMPMIDMTFGAQPMGMYPKISIGRPDEPTIADVTNALQWLGPQGLTVPATEVRQRLGFSEPEDGEDVVGGRAPTTSVTPAHTLPAEVRPAKEEPPQASAPTPQDEAEAGTKQTLHSQLGQVLIRHTRDNGPGLVSALSASAARECAEGFAAMCRPAQDAYEQATSLEDFRARLEAMKLPPEQLADAMANAIMVAEMAGEAMILDQMRTDG